MKRPLTWALALMGAGVTAFVLNFYLPEKSSMAAESSAEPMLAHNVYFSLKDSTPENRAKLVAACHKYLNGHPGTVFYAAGTVSNLDREVNDRDFDVGLHVIFKDRKAHDDYQTAPRHLEFIKENKETWKKVRVFDSDVTNK